MVESIYSNQRAERKLFLVNSVSLPLEKKWFIEPIGLRRKRLTAQEILKLRKQFPFLTKDLFEGALACVVVRDLERYVNGRVGEIKPLKRRVLNDPFFVLS